MNIAQYSAITSFLNIYMNKSLSVRSTNNSQIHHVIIIHNVTIDKTQTSLLKLPSSRHGLTHNELISKQGKSLVKDEGALNELTIMEP